MILAFIYQFKRVTMSHFNDLLMAIICGVLLFTINGFVIFAPLINLLFNFLMIGLLVAYIMQFLGLIKPILPSPKLFK